MDVYTGRRSVAVRVKNAAQDSAYANPAVGCGRASNAALRADQEAPATRCGDKTPLYAASIAGLALGCLPGNARSAVATAAIAANRHADRNT